MAFVLASFFLFEGALLTLWNDLLDSNTSLTVLGLLIVSLLAADIVLPTPSSLISVAAAVIFGTLVGGILIFIGMSLCCLLGYFLGRSGHSLVQKHSINTAGSSSSLNNWVKRWGVWSLLISRPIPVMAETSVVMAGVARVPFKQFLFFTIPANAVIAIIYGMLG